VVIDCGKSSYWNNENIMNNFAASVDWTW